MTAGIPFTQISRAKKVNSVEDNNRRSVDAGHLPLRQADTQLQPEVIRTTPYTTHELGEEGEDTKRANAWFYVWTVWESRRFLGRCALVGAVVALIMLYAMPWQYEATAQLMPPDSTSSGGLGAMAEMMSSKVSGLSENPMIGKYAGELLGAKTTGALFVGVLRSRTVEDRIIDKFDLRRVYSVRYYDAARKKLTAKTAILEDKKSGIITLTVTDRKAQRAADIAQEYVAQLNVLMAQLTTSSAHRERVFLEDRLQLAKKELDSAEKDLGEFSSKNGTVDVEDEGKAIVEAAASLQGELIAAQSEVKGLEQIYTADNIRVKSLHARIDELERKLNEIGGTKGISTSSAEQSSGAADRGDFLYPSLRQLPILGVRYGDLYLRAKIAEKVYEFLVQQYELARVQEAKEIPTVRALDNAIPPERRSWPPRTVFVALFGALLFIIVGALWIFGSREWRNIDPGDQRKLFFAEVFGTVGQSVASWRVTAYLRRRKPELFHVEHDPD